MAHSPLLPKATAVWLIDHTSLSFEQIATFCGMHLLEVQGIADGEVAVGIAGVDPIQAGQLTREEIARCEANPAAQLVLAPSLSIPSVQNGRRKTKGARYTPMARRQDKPDAIAWLMRHCPGIPDAKIIRLVGTTSQTIHAIRTKTHRNMATLRPRDPVLLGLCSQSALDALMEWHQANAVHHVPPGPRPTSHPMTGPDSF